MYIWKITQLSHHLAGIEWMSKPSGMSRRQKKETYNFNQTKPAIQPASHPDQKCTQMNVHGWDCNKIRLHEYQFEKHA